MSTAEKLPVEEPGEGAEETPERPRLELIPGPGWFLSWWSDLLPYLPTPSNLAGPLSGVGAGSAALIGRGWAWLWAEGWQDAAMRAGGVVLAGYAGANTFSALSGRYTGYIALAAVVGWCVAAKRHAPKTTSLRHPVETDPQAAAEDLEEPPATPSPDDVRTATLEWIRRLVGDTQGVHLRDLLAHAQAHGMFQDLEVADLKGHLERWDIPVRKRVRVRGRGVTVGIHRDDLQPPPPASPEEDAQEDPEPQLHVL